MLFLLALLGMFSGLGLLVASAAPKDDAGSGSKSNSDDESTGGSGTGTETSTDPEVGGAGNGSEETPSDLDPYTGSTTDTPPGDTGDSGGEPDPAQPEVEAPNVFETEVPEFDPEDPPNQLEGISADVLSGRVTVLELPDATNIAALRMIGVPEHGNITVNPDNTLAVVLSASDYAGALEFTYEVTDLDGNVSLYTGSLNVEADPVLGGWGLGEAHYMLETDENGDVIVETGEDHRKVYISGSEDALTRADIAALEGVSVEEVTRDFLLAREEYGGSEDMALAPDVAQGIWFKETFEQHSSTWLMLERGYEYDGFNNLFWQGAKGESELHPLHITAWGEGARPVILDRPDVIKYIENFVITDVEFAESARLLQGNNLLFEDVRFTGNELIVQGPDGVTIRDSEIIDVYKQAPKSGEDWQPHVDRVSGLYAEGIEGLLLEGLLVDYNGWREGYDGNLDGSLPQPPSMFSHGLYLQKNTSDVTLRDSFILRSSSMGAMVRGGGFVEDNIMIDNNIGLLLKTGVTSNGGTVASGNYSLANGNVITNPSGKWAEMIGARDWGFDSQAVMGSFMDNIIAHRSNPDDPAEIALKEGIGGFALRLVDGFFAPYFNDTIHYGWESRENSDSAPIDGDIDKATLDQTTIQRYAAGLLGQSTATIEDFANYLRSLPETALDDSYTTSSVLRFFQTGFGIYDAPRTEATTLTFVPDERADGMRWDNRENWDTEDLPGTIAGDSVDLNGNWVYFGGTAHIEDLDFGSGGRLYFNHGALHVKGDTTIGDWGAEVDIRGAGQFWINGYGDSATFDIDVFGGRFANTGDVLGNVNLSKNAGGQAILASDNGSFVVSAGRELALLNGEGSGSGIGFDGDQGGTAVLKVDTDGTINFQSGTSGFGTIEEFRSGRFGDAPDVQSGIHLGEGRLEIDVTKLAGAALSQDLMHVDAIAGRFGEVDFIGLAADQDATLTVDYATDRVTLDVTAAGTGTGSVSVAYAGDETDDQAAADLWAALTAGQPATDDTVETEIYLDGEEYIASLAA